MRICFSQEKIGSGIHIGQKHMFVDGMKWSRARTQNQALTDAGCKGFLDKQ